MDQCLESDCEGDFPVSSAPHLGVLRVCNNTKEGVWARQEHHQGDILLSFSAADIFMVFLLLGSSCAQNTAEG